MNQILTTILESRITATILGAAITAITSIITIHFNNKHNTKIVEKQIKSTETQALQHYNFELNKIALEKRYKDKAEIIGNILLIQSENNLTKNYIMELSNANEFTANQKYENIVKAVNQVIVKLYLSFPKLANYGYEIQGKCNEIWGNEQNYFGYQKDKKVAQNNTKGKLIGLYGELNEICSNCLNELENAK